MNALEIVLGIIILVAGLIFFQPDLGTTIIYLMLFVIMFYAAPQDETFKKKMTLIGIGALLLGGLLFSSG